MRAKKNQNIGLCLSTFLFSIFLSVSTWAAPSVTTASTNNLKVYLEQIIGNDSYRNYKNIEELLSKFEILEKVKFEIRNNTVTIKEYKKGRDCW